RARGAESSDERRAAGIQSPGKKQTQRHVAHQMTLHRTLEPGSELRRLLGKWDVQIHAVLRRMPVPPDAASLLRRPLEQMAREELADSAIERLLARHVPVREIFRKDRLVERYFQPAGCEDSLDFRRK